MRADNEAKQGPDVLRKSGIIINSGGERAGRDASHARTRASPTFGIVLSAGCRPLCAQGS